jgi:hypothetical protein
MFISLFAIFLTTLYSVVVLKILMNVHTIYIYTRTVPSHVDLFFLHQQDYYRTVLWVTWRMSHKTQHTLALCELLGLPRSFLRSVLLIFLYFCVVFFVFFCSLCVLCPNAARISELSIHDCLFGFFKLKHPSWFNGCTDLFVVLGLNCKYCSLDALPIFRLWLYVMKS